MRNAALNVVKNHAGIDADGRFKVQRSGRKRFGKTPLPQRVFRLVLRVVFRPVLRAVLCAFCVHCGAPFRYKLFYKDIGGKPFAFSIRARTVIGRPYSVIKPSAS